MESRKPGLRSIVLCSFAWAAAHLFSPALYAATGDSEALAPVILGGTLTLTPHTDPGPGNEAWTLTYTEPGWATTATGIIIKPMGAGPFPGVVASHGKGGNAGGFGMQKGKNWFAPNGYITIAVDYTHAGRVSCSGAASQCGGSAENVRRSNRAFQLLQSQTLIDQIGDVVDRGRIVLYGNSLGAMTTIELAEILGSRVRSIALTAGGISVAAGFSYMTPHGTAGIADIYAPLIHLHGRRDGVVPASAQYQLSNALDLNNKIHQQVWFPDGGHNIARALMTENQVRDSILAWFSAFLDRASPSISVLSISSGQAGDSVDISGRNFGSNENAGSSVDIGGVTAEIVSWSDTAITATVSAGAVTGSVEVIVPVGPIADPVIEQPVNGGVRSNRLNFTIL